MTKENTGKVILIGAGPGDPGLLTLRGRDALATADVVLYDYLASVELLRFVPDGAERICLGRHGQGRVLSQEEINRRMVAEAAAGKRVVRLKGGDPGIFGRLAEEVTALEHAKIPYEIVPGITAAIAAGAYAGVTLTHRDHASCLAIVTGQEHPAKEEESLDFAALAAFPGTLVFYMGMTSAPRWSAQLLAHGKPGNTQVRIVRRVSHPEQQMWTCQLDQVADVIEQEKIRPPALCIVGRVIANERLADWFVNRPLFGKTVLVTRPHHQGDELGSALADLGARVYYQPAITIGPPDDWGPVDRVIERLQEFAWIVFSSRNGVVAFLDRLVAQGHDLRSLAGCQLAAIGPGTSGTLAEYHLKTDLQPKQHLAEALAEALAMYAKGKRFLLVRASRGREVLAERLSAAGGVVEQVVAYESRDVTQADPEVAAALDGGEIDWTTVTSSAIARSLASLFGTSLRHTQLAAISPLTAGVLADVGCSAAAVADTYTCEGLIQAILKAEGAC